MNNHQGITFKKTSLKEGQTKQIIDQPCCGGISCSVNAKDYTALQEIFAIFKCHPVHPLDIYL